MGTVSDIINAMMPFEEDLVIHMILGAIDSAVPFLALPVISQIIQVIVTQFVDFIVVRLNLFIINTATIIETGMQDSKFKAAAEANLAAQTGSDDDKKKAKDNLLIVARSFIRLNTP